MNTTISNIIENDIHLVGAYNAEEDYMLWQKTENESEIHFEWNSQANSGYDNIKECTLDKDGMHILLKNSKILHFYFINCAYSDWENLSVGLKKIYMNNSSVLDIHD